MPLSSVASTTEAPPALPTVQPSFTVQVSSLGTPRISTSSVVQEFRHRTQVGRGGMAAPSGAPNMSLPSSDAMLPISTRSATYGGPPGFPSGFHKRDSGVTQPAVRVGDSLYLFSDTYNTVLACDGFLSSSCVPACSHAPLLLPPPLLSEYVDVSQVCGSELGD